MCHVHRSKNKFFTLLSKSSDYLSTFEQIIALLNKETCAFERTKIENFENLTNTEGITYVNEQKPLLNKTFSPKRILLNKSKPCVQNHHNLLKNKAHLMKVLIFVQKQILALLIKS